MRYLALATDYDGTLAHDGRVDAVTLRALERLAGTGRKLILVTGRELPDLEAVFPEIARFDLVVAENGALLYTPATRATRVLGKAPPGAFVAELERRGIAPLSVGASIVATWHPTRIAAAAKSILIAGTSGSGKSTLTTSLLEQLLAQRYQCCVIDPEGDYGELKDVIMFGTAERAPEVAEIMTALERPDESVVVNLLGVKLQDRPAFFASLQLAEGVDEDTWLHHLRAGDYSQWLANCIKDESLAEEVREVERRGADLGAGESRARVRAAIEQRYTLPENASPL